jgi:hypothetical protein
MSHAIPSQNDQMLKVGGSFENWSQVSILKQSQTLSNFFIKASLDNILNTY